MLNNLMSFDIETVPDIDFIRKKYAPLYDDTSDKETVYAVREHYGSDFLPVIYHKVVAISYTYLTVDRISMMNSKVAIQTVQGETEKDIVGNFIKLIDKMVPNLIGWNSKGFDIQVLNYRMMKYMIHSKVLHRTDGEFKYNNYVNRYHDKHMDLMDKVSCFSHGAKTNLQSICISLGLPGKFSFDRDQLFEDWLEGKFKEINEYCELDTLNVMVVYLKWAYVTNFMDLHTYSQIEKMLRVNLLKSGQPHLVDFAKLWEM